jgi:GTP-binding protein
MAAKKKIVPKEPPKKVPPSRPGDRVIEAEFLAGATTLAQFPPPAFSEIAFAGRSNVGKSSLMNCLTQRIGLVRTSSTPGCTRQVSWFRSTSDDKAIIDLVDLPGYGYAKRSKSERREWAGLIEGYLLERATLRGVVMLIDVRRGLEPDDAELLEMLGEGARVSRSPLELMIVATKLDKLSMSKHKPAIEQLQKEIGRPVLGFSSETGIGRIPLWRRIRRVAGVGLDAATENESRVAPDDGNIALSDSAVEANEA